MKRNGYTFIEALIMVVCAVVVLAAGIGSCYGISARRDRLHQRNQQTAAYLSDVEDKATAWADTMGYDVKGLSCARNERWANCDVSLNVPNGEVKIIGVVCAWNRLAESGGCSLRRGAE